MKTITAKTLHDTSFSISKRFLHWKKKVEDDDNEEQILTFNSSNFFEELKEDEPTETALVPTKRKKSPLISVSKLRLLFGKNPLNPNSIHGNRVIVTLFGHRRGHVHFAFQEEPRLLPPFLIELATPTSVLVREMASGLVRIALECEKKTEKQKRIKLLEEPIWRTYCNGKKCGFATKRDCGVEDWKVLKAVEMISMGAGVLPEYGNGAGGSDEGEVMYMRARFERVIGSRDSEAFYMMNPDKSSGPELSIYLLRV